MPLLHLGIPDQFIEHGSRDDCLKMAGLDPAALEAAIERFWQRPGLARRRTPRPRETVTAGAAPRAPTAACV